MCLTCPYLPPSIPNVSSPAVCSYCFRPCILFCFFLVPFCISQSVESRECGRIESQLADWIVFCTISDCIKQLRLWTYKKVMDASSFLLDRSELTSADGRKGKKKETDLLTRLVKAVERMNATQLPLLLCLSFCFTFPSHHVWKESAS